MARVARDGGFPDGWYPSERIGFIEAVSGFTSANAVAAGAADRRGRLAPGYDADLVAWEVDAGVERDLGEAFSAGRALLTVVGGEVVFGP
jgi:hypothetical protein